MLDGIKFIYCFFQVRICYSWTYKNVTCIDGIDTALDQLNNMKSKFCLNHIGYLAFLKLKCSTFKFRYKASPVSPTKISTFPGATILGIFSCHLAKISSLFDLFFDIINFFQGFGSFFRIHNGINYNFSQLYFRIEIWQTIHRNMIKKINYFRWSNLYFLHDL